MTQSPNPFQRLILRAQALRADGQRAGLADCLSEARRAASGNAAAQAALADFHSKSEDYTAALEAYDEVVRLAPGHVGIRYNRATIRRFLGLLEGAEHDLDAVIAATPEDSEAWHLRSDLRIQTPGRNHVATLEGRVSQGFKGWQDEVPIRFALAKELEDLGRYADAWRQLQVGASLRRRHLQYDVRVDVATVDWICDAFMETVSPEAQLPATGPLFIVGMPRTGTTLLERLIAQHSEVQAAGEMPYFANALVAAVQSAAGRKDLTRPALVAASARVDFKRLGADYLQLTAVHARGRPRFIDKLPLNYLYCGIIRRALPGARILHITRHPLATGYAVYKTLFAQGYPFSYDLGEIAAYYSSYRRLMALWHSTLPGQILDVPYEHLVRDPQGEGRRVFEYCGLEWKDEYVNVQGDPRQVTTASASQVRRPIYQTSIDLWRQYEQQLQPLAQRLQSFL